ncbi:hypothetical protein [Aliikangiella sp. IMCC44359]
MKSKQEQLSDYLDKELNKVDKQSTINARRMAQKMRLLSNAIANEIDKTK